jgi:hypothetical protein
VFRDDLLFGRWALLRAAAGNGEGRAAAGALPGWWRFQAQGEGLQVEALFSGQNVAALEKLLDGTQAILHLQDMLRQALG